MLVSHKFDHEAKVVITTFAPEEVNLELFLKSFIRYQEELAYLPDFQTYDELVDFRPITSIKISASELKEFGNFTLAKDTRETVTRLALLVESTPAFTLAKVYETYRNLQPASRKKVKVFRDMDEALGWLAEDKKQ